jgi:hypothetical protein
MKATETKSSHSQQHAAAETATWEQTQEPAFFSEPAAENTPFFQNSAPPGIQTKFSSGAAPFFQPARTLSIQAKCAAYEAEEHPAVEPETQRMPAFESEADTDIQPKLLIQRMPAFESEADADIQPKLLIQRMPAFESEAEADIQPKLLIQRMPAFESEADADIQPKLLIQRMPAFESQVGIPVPPKSLIQRQTETELEPEEEPGPNADLQPKLIGSAVDPPDDAGEDTPNTRPFTQAKLTIGRPNDPFEQEADAVAERVVALSQLQGNPKPGLQAKPVTIQPLGKTITRVTQRQVAPLEPKQLQPSPQVQKQGDGSLTAGSDVAGRLSSSRGGGQALDKQTRNEMEAAFGANFGKVRIHTGSDAAQLNQDIGAKAFTHGSDIYFNKGQYNPASQAGKQLLAHELTHTVQQGVATQYGENASVTHQSPVQVQGLFGDSEILNSFAAKADATIPGFRMLTIILGVNPITMQSVDRSPANIMRAVVGLMPGGGLIVQALDNYGIFDKIANWVDQQIKTLGIIGSAIRQAIMDFIARRSLTDLANLGAVWQEAKQIFTGPIERIKSFVIGLASDVLQLIKDAILRPLAALAEGTAGYDLLKAVLGKDPITGDPVPASPDILIGGFMKLIGQEDVWNNLKKANAVPRAFAWFKGALGQVKSLVQKIPSLFIKAFKALKIGDIVQLPTAFAKVASLFSDVISPFMSWAGNAVWNLLEIIFDVVAPGVLGYIKKAGGAFKSILQNPIGFAGNLVQAGKQGLMQFASNIGEHLKTSLIQWLTGTLAGTGVYIPQALSLREIIKFVLSVLGLTWQNIRQKLVRVVGEPVVQAMETGFEIVKTLVTEGPAAAWEIIKAQLSNLQEMVMGEIISFVTSKIVESAITKLVSMLNPVVGGIVQGALGIYNTIMFFIERMRTIAQVAASFIDSIAAIANGVISAAASRVEKTLAGLLTLAISFLARLAGLGKVSDAVTNIINKIRQPINKALDKVVAWIVKVGKKFIKKAKKSISKKSVGKLSGKKDKAESEQGANIKLAVSTDMNGEGHTIYTEVQDGKLVVGMASSQRTKLLGLTAQAMGQTDNKKAVRRLQNVWSRLKDAEEKVNFLVSDRKRDAEALAEAEKMTQDVANQLKGIGKEFGIPSLLVLPHKSNFVEATVSGYRIKSDFQKDIREKFYPSDYDPSVYKWKEKFISKNTDPKNKANFLDKEGRSEPKLEATIDHQPRVVEHWESNGKQTTQSERANWYRGSGGNSKHLSIIARKYNSSDGAEARNKGLRYTPDNIGKGFLGPGET